MAKPNIQVHEAAASDATGIASVHVRSWQSAYRGQIPDDVLDSMDTSKRAARWFDLISQPGHVVHVAVHEETIVGFSSLIRSRDPGSPDDTGEIAGLYVDPGHWRAGVGRVLLGESLDAARATRYRVITFWVLSSNERGRRFYEHLGFAPDGESKVDERETYSLHELRYRRDLSPIAS